MSNRTLISLVACGVVSLAVMSSASTSARADDPAKDAARDPAKNQADDASTGRVAPIGSGTGGIKRPVGVVSGYTGPPVELKLSGDHTFPVTFRSSSGTLAVSHGGISLSAAGPPIGDSPQVLPLLEVSGESSLYDLRRTNTIVPGFSQPWKALYSASAAPTAVIVLDDSKRVVLAANLKWAGEATANLMESLTEGAFVGFGFDADPTLAITLGLFAQTRLEHRPLIFPLLGIDWKPTDWLEVELGKDGVRAAVGVVPRKLRATVSLGGELREFRLSDKSDSLPGGIVRDERMLFLVGLEWTPIPGLKLQVSGGCVPYERLIVNDHIGKIVSKDTTASVAPEVGAKLWVQF